ncbi:MAG: pitrilysin family protein [Bdellovibrionota bacterium]
MRILLTVLFLFSFPALAAEGLSSLKFEVEKYQLPNGLTVLLHEDHSVPLVSYHTWFRVGSKDEELGYTGIAHLFEHMMFKGTQKYSNKDYERTLRENGASNNAFTSRDYTGYYVNGPSSKLETIMDLESDRIEHLNLTQANLDSEREVVKEERRFRVENRVMGLLMEKINDVVYKVHSYRWPVIGYMKDLGNITVEKAQSFYKTFYSPNNAVLVIAGDFNSGKVKKLIEKYYGHMKSQDIKRPKVNPEPPQKSIRNEVFYKDIQNDYLSISFPVPSALSLELAPLELASHILGEGNSSRLHSKLVYKQEIATSVMTYIMSNQESSVFQIIVALKPQKSKAQADKILEQAKKEIYSELFNLRNKSVSLDEVSKAQNQAAKSFIDALKTIDGRAYSLASNEIVVGSYEKLFTDLENYMRVKPAEIKGVSEKYLKNTQANVVVARPERFK